MNLAIAVDLSVESHFAVRWALDLRDRARDRGESVTCHAIHVPSPSAPFAIQNFTGFGRADEEPGLHRQMVHQVRDFLESVSPDVDDVEIVVQDGDAPKIISKFCIAHQVDWLVTGMSTIGPVGRFFLGSTVHKLADRAPCRLAVVHPEHASLEGPVDLVVGVDFLPGSEAALFAAAELANHTDGHLCLLHALQDAPTGSVHGGLTTYLSTSDSANLTLASRRALHRMMDEVVQLYPDVTYDVFVDTGGARQVLSDAVTRRNSDILLLGKVRHPTIERLALGSVSRQILKRMPTTLVFAPPEVR